MYGDLHDFIWVPQDGIVVEIDSRVEPQVELHLPADVSPVAGSPDVHVCLQPVRLPRSVPHELDVYLIMGSRMRLVV